MSKGAIVAVETFIQAIRDSGYKSTAAAVSELVDNSFEADAGCVSIEAAVDESLTPVLKVDDDGTGIDPELMQIALQFGGSTRFNSRTGAGRYGMGLPCSSLSQARRVDLFSWKKPGRVWWTYLDIDEIIDSGRTHVPEPRQAASELARTLPRSNSGTTVILSKCDRLDYRRLSTISAKLNRGLGRTFRRFITDGKTIVLNHDAIAPVDPLFLNPIAVVSGGKPFGPPMEFPVRVPGGKRTSTIRVVLSELPVEKWHALPNEEKNRYGISKSAGVSVLRAGREIDHGWFFMGGKRKENYDDWWRCEVEFDPALDELFGVTHTKQKINPTDAVNEILVPHLEPLARELNNRVRRAFLKLRLNSGETAAGKRAENLDVFLEPPTRALQGRKASNGTAQATRRIAGLAYKVAARELEGDLFFDSELSKRQVSLSLNSGHRFYDRVYDKLCHSENPHDRSCREAVELLLLAFARAESGFVRRQDRDVASKLKAKWSQALATFLD